MSKWQLTQETDPDMRIYTHNTPVTTFTMAMPTVTTGSPIH